LTPCFRVTTSAARVPPGERAARPRERVFSGAGRSGSFFPSGVKTQKSPARPRSRGPGPAGLAAGGAGCFTAAGRASATGAGLTGGFGASWADDGGAPPATTQARARRRVPAADPIELAQHDRRPEVVRQRGELLVEGGQGVGVRGLAGRCRAVWGGRDGDLPGAAAGGHSAGLLGATGGDAVEPAAD